MRFGFCLIALFAASCDIPTELPKWNPTFAVPLEVTSIPLAQLLPAGMDVSPDGTQFLLSVAAFAGQNRLSDVCTACRPLDGQTVPKPAFAGTVFYSIDPPSGVDSASILGGTLNIAVTNGWSFDPLRPAAGQTGAITITVLPVDNRPRGVASFPGQQHAFPPGSTLAGAVNFAGAPTRSIILRVDIWSPAGDPVRIDGASAVRFAVTSGQMVASDATINISPRQLTGLPISLDLSGIDDFVIERVEGGRLILTIDNGFSVRGLMTLTISGGRTNVVKTFTLEADDTTSEVMLTEAELESILGYSVVASVSGFVSTNGPVLVTPSSTFTVKPLLVVDLGPDS